MNKKNLIIYIVGIILIILILLFVLKSCNPRKKPADDGTGNLITETDDTADTDLTIDNTLDLTKYRDPFINANTDFTCDTIANPNLLKDEKMMKSRLNDAYEKYDFPVEDNDLMIQILNKYENDTDVINIIRENVKDCKTE